MNTKDNEKYISFFGCNNKWKSNNWRTASKKPVANRDLWMEVDELSNTLNVEWHWVKGHDGDPGNERADYLANLGADSVS